MKKVSIEKIDCIFCQIAQSETVISENKWQGNQCNICSLIYISPRPTEAETLNLYGHDSAHISAQTHISGEYYSRLHAQHTLALIKKYKKYGALLEVGAGAGFFLDEAAKLGFHPYAIELNPVQAQFIINTLYISCEQKVLSAKSFGAQLFDIIYHCDVISHFHNPINAFESMYTKLNAEGLLVFETGNIADMNRKFYPSFSCFQYPDHLFFFGEKTLQTLLNKTGFRLIKIYRYNIMFHLWIQQLRRWQKDYAIVFQNKERINNTSSSIFKKAYQRMLFMLRYKIGAWLPKRSRPLSLIVIAEKIL